MTLPEMQHLFRCEPSRGTWDMPLLDRNSQVGLDSQGTFSQRCAASKCFLQITALRRVEAKQLAAEQR